MNPIGPNHRGSPGRNDPCPCGSGRKYKTCCLDPRAKPQIPVGLPMGALRKLREQETKERERQDRYGFARPVIHLDHGGRKCVAVGRKLYCGNWPTFTDFLMDYVRIALGDEWWEAESAKTPAEQHQALRWFEGLRQVQRRMTRNEDGYFSVKPNGSVSAFIHLAYDLYVLGHHSRLQERIIRRMRLADQFQGARYELFATATCIRAGFEIDFEDETDPTKKHPEFTAIHLRDGLEISVEAKSKHRPGVLGYPGKRMTDEAVCARVGQLLNQAFRKRTALPLVVFVDVNLPPDRAAAVFESYRDGWPAMLSKVRRTQNGRDLFNLVIFTNCPHHYAREDQADPMQHVLLVRSQAPRIPVANLQPLLGLEQAVLQYSNVPSWFSDDSPEAEKYGRGLGHVVTSSTPWRAHLEGSPRKRMNLRKQDG